MSSRQLQTYLSLRFVDEMSREDAAAEAGFSAEEARLTDEAVARGDIVVPSKDAASPLGTAFERARAHLGTTEQPPPPRPSTPIQQGETTMPRSRQPTQDNEEVKQPDFERAVRIYRQDIKPAVEKSGEHAQLASTGYKAIKKECRVNTRAARFVFGLERESEEKRNDVLRSLRGMLAAMNIGITDDLVSQAENEDGDAPIVPTAEARRPQLATVQ